MEGAKLALVRKIGEGSYGRVYLAQVQKEEREGRGEDEKVAVKVIRKDTNNGIECLIEPILMSVFSHYNITQCIAMQNTTTRIYCVQELATTDLYNWRMKNKPNENTIRNWIFSLLCACDCLHSNNIVHADIKPGNVLIYEREDQLPEEYCLKLCDFTLAYNRRWKRICDHFICTEPYRAPEVFFEMDWDERVDIWSVGCVLFEMVYGYLLFPVQDTKEGYLNAILEWSQQPFVGSKINGLQYVGDYERLNIPEDLSDSHPIHQLILKMLTLSYEERPTARELLEMDYFEGLKEPEYEVYEPPLHPIDPSNLLAVRSNMQRKINDPTIIEQALLIYSSILQLTHMKTLDKVNASLFIASKLCVREYVSIPGADIDTLILHEKRITSYLNWVLPVLGK